MPWFLATLTLALALAGPAYADSLGTEEMAEAEQMLAEEVPEVPAEEPPELPDPEPVVETVEEPAPVPAPVEAPPPATPAEEPAAAAVEPAPEPATPVEELAAETPAEGVDEQSPVEPTDVDAEDPTPSVVVPLNLNVDIRILSPGNDGDVTQVIDMGQLPGFGAGSPGDVLGDLDTGLDWSWNWNWSWDCGDASAAGLDWNWNWSWSGDCAGGVLDEPGHELDPFGERPRGEHETDLLDAVEGFGAPPEIDAGSAPVVTAHGGGDAVQRGERDDAGPAPLPAPPSGDSGLPAPSPATTSFASTGAVVRSGSATAPAQRPVGADPNGDPERRPAGPPAQALGLASAAGAAGGGGGGLTVLLLAALLSALALVPPPPGGRLRAYGRTLSSLLSSSRLERPG